MIVTDGAVSRPPSALSRQPSAVSQNQTPLTAEKPRQKAQAAIGVRLWIDAER
jgi:hypothetical protein